MINFFSLFHSWSFWWLVCTFRHDQQTYRSGQTIDAGNRRLLLTSSPAYYTFLETTENYTLQIQRKNQVLFIGSLFITSPSLHASPSPRVPRPWVLRLRVPRLWVSASPSLSHISMCQLMIKISVNRCATICSFLNSIILQVLICNLLFLNS